MGEVVEIAGIGRVVGGVGHGNIAAGPTMWLLDAQGRGPDLGRRLKRVAHVVEENKTNVSTHPTQVRRRHAELRGVHEDTVAANRISSLGIARSGGIDGKAAMRGRAPGVEPLR